MTNRNKLIRKRLAYEKIKRATDFELRYGNERNLGKQIIKEQNLRDKVLRLQKEKEVYSK